MPILKRTATNILNCTVKNILIGILNKNVRINIIVANIFALNGIVEPYIKPNASTPIS